MHIGIDARMIGSMGVRGIGRYTMELVKQCQAHAHVHDFTIITTPEAPLKEGPHFHVIRTSIPWYSLQEQTQLPRLLRKLNLDLVHFPHFNVPILYRHPYIITIHDILLRRYPSALVTTRSLAVFGVKYLGYRFVLWNALRTARVAVTISKFSRDEILSFYPFARKRVHVLYEGVTFDPSTTPLEYPSDIQQPYLLYVGSAYPHKNLDFMVTRFHEWNQRYSSYHLLIVGKHDVFTSRLGALIAGMKIRNVHILGAVTDEHLAVLYRNAHAFVMPSLYEGFGLPPLEAMSYGIPVLASDRGSLPEVLGDAALYFSPDDAAQFKNHLTMICTDTTLRSDLSRRGLERSKQYTWDAMGKEMLRLYETVAG